MIFLDELQATVRGAAASNPYAEESPVCVLWTDGERLFEPLLPALQAGMPELFVLGEYSPEERRGPAIWLRYMLDGGRITGENTPIFYLPGVSRSQLRPEDDCEFLLAPLCELIFRGKAWAHENGKDWTPAGLLLSLGVEVQGDGLTREALGRALRQVARCDLDDLRAQSPINAGVLNDLLNPDPVEALLGWINAPQDWQARHTQEEWAAFEATCKSKYKFSPSKDGELKAGELLGGRQGAWEKVWRSFERSPQLYLGVRDVLSRVRPNRDDLFFEKSSWPQWNEDEEANLRLSLLALADVTATEARSHIQELESLHGERRAWLWGKLGQAPLANALEHLWLLAKGTVQPLVGQSPQEFAENWVQNGWRYDAALLDALAAVEAPADFEAVKTAARALYRDWLNEGSSRFGQLVKQAPLSAGTGFAAPEAGVCVLFADGLRFDVAQKLATELSNIGLTTEWRWQFGPLPGVTPTAKPASTPLGTDTFAGGANLDARFADGRKVTAESLRSEMGKAGLQILMGADTGNPATGPAWTECGAFDSTGHGYGAALAQRISGEVRDLASRIRSLLNAGWKEVRITTDHGWVLLPGGLEKAHLPEHLTEVRKGRCARLKPGAVTEFQTVPWHWDQTVDIAIAPGVRCFEEGKEYEHGGLSVQECVLPLLTVTSGMKKKKGLVRLSKPQWRGFRCIVTLDLAGEALPLGYKVDLRTKAADPSTSLCDGGKFLSKESVTLMISDEHRGISANIVLLDELSNVVDKFSTEVPED